MRNILKTFLLLSLVPLLSGCDIAMFQPKGTIAADEIRLIVIAFILMLLVVIPVIVMTIVIAWRYRASNTKATYEPDWSHSVKLEILWWTIPCVIILILAIITWEMSHKLDPYRPLESNTKAVTIQAVALDWKWVFIYPDQGIATINYIEVPLDTPISFEITSQGPMNALWIPQLGGQIYAMAGMRTRLQLIANEAGVYDGLSGNYSGPGFAEMTFKVKAESSTEFAQWVASVKKTHNPLSQAGFDAMIAPTKNVPVQLFSSIAPNLFNNEVMKFMMPMDGKSMDCMNMNHSQETTSAVE